ncbi:Transglutaminase-like superfamily protein [anaerobic digester metagenome]
MRIIKSFLQLPNREKLVAIESLLWVIWIRIMIWVLPFASVQRRVQKRGGNLHSIPKISIHRLRTMIMVAARYVPRATCLVQALSGYILFSKYGYHPTIKIGVLTDNGEFEAHAWLEQDEKVVLGESEKDFQTILGID